MKATTWSCALTAILLVVAVGWMWKRETALRADEVELSTECARVRRLHLRVANRQRQDVLNAERRTASTKPASIAADASAAAAISKLAASLPEYAQAERAFWQRVMMLQYGEWFATLNLSADRASAIKQAMAVELIRQRDAIRALAESGFSGNRPEDPALNKKLDAESKARIQQFLTPEEYASFLHFDKAQAWVNRLPEVDDFFADSGVQSLTATQRRAFVEACVEAGTWEPDDRTLPPVPKERLKVERIAALAAAHLDPERQKALEGYIRFYNERMKITDELLKP